jgi:hypothetical protein
MVSRSGSENLLRIALKKQEFRALVERFGATKSGSRIAKRLRNMVGTWGLEPQTSTVSKPAINAKGVNSRRNRQNRNTRRNLLPNYYQKHGKWVRG